MSSISWLNFLVPLYFSIHCYLASTPNHSIGTILTGMETFAVESLNDSMI